MVVTGAGGFIGGFVARRLADLGCEVTAIARRPVGEARRGLAWREADLRSPGSLPVRFDALLHCAAETPERCPVPADLYQRNMDLSRSVFEQAVAARAQTVVLLSSMAAYGTVSVREVTEDTPPGALDPYGHAKRGGEGLLEACVARGLPSGLSIRLPGTMGKGSHDNFLSIAFNRALAGELVKASNPEAPFNNIVYVGDLAVFLEAWVTQPRPGYAVTNLAAAEPLPMREVLSVMFAAAGLQEHFVFEPGGKKPFLVSLDRAIALGYKPSSVKASIEAFVHDSR